ncbi:SDR family NAD(P)-dependent oxidoreductase [Gordonia sp. KTR9]|uniref:SDR family NAD(P)-dependent oxidoreductase n=1 Tax=Gordonia sp. KTR9 TaxID=337191 RepID=UPI00027DDC0C|nr:SDR family oxidoreductase [Gordonia sp. KTR9]AFR48191.1 short-chain dehydorgenase/reductase [Gordonia sp. KTR9]
MTTGTRPWAVVLGASGGLGRACAAALAADGWDIVLHYRSNKDGADRTAALVSDNGGESVAVASDLSDPADVLRMRSQLNVPISGLVYAAGPYIPMDFIANTPPDVFGNQLDQDTKAFYNAVHAFVPMLRDTRGAITAVVTPVIERYTRADILSSAPKAAIQAIVRGLAVEEGRFGVTVNAVGVGVIEGEGLWGALNENGAFTEKGLSQALSAVPLKRFGTPEDVAGAVRFLMSPAASWITGQTLNVDGGYSV